jgi:hypothetical protein
VRAFNGAIIDYTTQKKAYWTYLVKRWYPGYLESTMGGQQMRMRELTRMFLVSHMGFDHALYVPEGLQQQFKREVEAFRNKHCPPEVRSGVPSEIV